MLACIYDVRCTLKIRMTDEENDVIKRKLKVAKRGQEPWEFTRCFHGWSS